MSLPGQMDAEKLSGLPGLALAPLVRVDAARAALQYHHCWSNDGGLQASVHRPLDCIHYDCKCCSVVPSLRSNDEGLQASVHRPLDCIHYDLN